MPTEMMTSLQDTCPFSSACSLFQLVPFGPGLYKLACLFYTTLSFFIQAFIFFVQLVSFFTQNLSQKRHNPCSSRSHPCRAQLLLTFFKVFASALSSALFTCGRHVLYSCYQIYFVLLLLNDSSVFVIFCEDGTSVFL